MIDVKVKRVYPNVVLPKYAHESDAGMDIFALEDVTLYSNDSVLVKTGIKLEIPYGYEAQIRSRSGLAKYGVAVLNSPGTIDSGYRGEIGVILMNHGEEPYHIKAWNAIAQMVFAPVLKANLVEVRELSDSDRGSDGFGSTDGG